MRFLLDESADARLAGYLQGLGHDVAAIAKEYPASLKDPEVLAIARREQRILITADRDFGELVFKQHQPHAGVLYLRLPPTELSVKIARLAEALSQDPDQLAQFLVVTARSVRVRQVK